MMTTPTTMPKASRLAQAAAFVAMASALTAQESITFKKVNFGAQISAMQPLGELADYAATGFGASMYVEHVWSSSWALRCRLEYLLLGQKTGVISDSLHDFELKSNINQMGIMADCIYYSGLGDVPYLFAGIGIFKRDNTGTVKMREKSTGNYYEWEWSKLDTDAVRTTAAVSIGTGWNFHKRLGTELKVTSSGTMTWAQASLLYRF
jgi:hypothetical protein